MLNGVFCSDCEHIRKVFGGYEHAKCKVSHIDYASRGVGSLQFCSIKNSGGCCRDFEPKKPSPIFNLWRIIKKWI